MLFLLKRKFKNKKGGGGKPPTKTVRHFPNRMVKIKNAINEGEGVEEGGESTFYGDANLAPK